MPVKSRLDGADRRTLRLRCRGWRAVRVHQDGRRCEKSEERQDRLAVEDDLEHAVDDQAQQANPESESECPGPRLRRARCPKCRNDAARQQAQHCEQPHQSLLGERLR